MVTELAVIDPSSEGKIELPPDIHEIPWMTSLKATGKKAAYE